MLVYGKFDHTTVNGPGIRAALWFAGCTLNCAGCHNPGTHRFDDSKRVNLSEIQTWLMNLGIEGITFSGGEPLQHYFDLLMVCRFLRDVRPELSIGIFTGYTARELETGNWQTLHPSGVLIPGHGDAWDKLRPLLDFAIMGRFNLSKMITSKPLCGSSNQDIVLFSDRYSAADFKPQAVNVTISPEGLIQITGFPGVEFIETVKGL